LETITGNIVISGVDALMCVVLSKAEKYVAYGELVGSVPHNIQRYIRGDAQTEVVITRVNFISVFPLVITMNSDYFPKQN
jgi:hypothetical protein